MRIYGLKDYFTFETNLSTDGVRSLRSRFISWQTKKTKV